MSKADVTIAMQGPYRSADTDVSRSRYPSAPNFASAPEHQLVGIYLQVIRLGESYRVAYVGETNATFADRHIAGNRSWCKPPFKDTTAWQVAACKQFSEALEIYPPLFRSGIRAYVRVAEDNTQQRCAMRQEILDDTLLFFGHLEAEYIEKRKAIEAAIIRHLKGHLHRKGYPPGVPEFLYNELKGLAAEKFVGTLKIDAPGNIVIEGLETPFTDPSI